MRIAATTFECFVAVTHPLRHYSCHCRAAATTAIPFTSWQVCMNYIDLLVTAASVVELIVSQVTVNPMLFRDSVRIDLATSHYPEGPSTLLLWS